MSQRQRVADRARLFYWRHDGDLAQRTQSLHERADAIRSIAVVVGNQDSFHGLERLPAISFQLQHSYQLSAFRHRLPAASSNAAEG